MLKTAYGDCLDVMTHIKDNSIDMIFCDLPYGTTKCKWDIILPFDKLWVQYKRIAKNTTPILLFGTEPFSSKLRLSNLEMYRYDWYWNKKRAANFLFMNKQPGKIVETISVFYVNQPCYNPIKRDNPLGIRNKDAFKDRHKISQNVKDLMGDTWVAPELNHGKDYEPDKLLPNNIIEVSKDIRRFHPTQKPVPLLEYLIKTYTEEGETILDNCMGSGSTGIACNNTNRNFIGIEKDKEIYDVAIQRLGEALI